MDAPLFKRLSREEFNRLNLTQKMIYLRALVAEAHGRVQDERQTVDHGNPISQALRRLTKRIRKTG
ncbi:MAG: hypothetical protein JO292_01070 [Betaproteobacteria bacterium]|nr:hypothetical protein [Betaproteobacteria bacterium]MBV9359956.1 hypothetical protein [Betaproteobacteria bacterium]